LSVCLLANVRNICQGNQSRQHLWLQSHIVWGWSKLCGEDSSREGRWKKKKKVMIWTVSLHLWATSQRWKNLQGDLGMHQSWIQVLPGPGAGRT